jgi:hypothetical protein
VLTGLLILAFTILSYRRFVAGYPPAPAGLALLHRGEAAFVQAAAEVLFPGGAGLSVRGVDARLPHYVDRHLAALPRSQRLQIRALLLVFEHLPLFVSSNAPGGHGRFSSLTAASRVEVLERALGHPNGFVQMLFVALRAVLVLGYLGHPANLHGLGLAPFEIESGVSDAELLFPRVGGLGSSIGYSPLDRTDPMLLDPLDPHGPRHRAYARSGRDR